MATVVNQRDVLLLAASPRILPINLPSNVTVPKTQVTGLGTLASQNTVSQPDFAVGIEPVGLVSSLPNPVGYTGVKVVFNTSDGKLYRYVSGAWTVAVPAVDVTGQLTNAQIADIAAAKLTGQITETQITDGAISTPKLLAGSVSTAKLATGSVTTDILAANSVTAANIVAGQVTTAKLAAGAVTANELAANSVIAGKISAGAIATTNLSANCVTAAKMSVSQLSAITADIGVITAGSLTANVTIVSDGNIKARGQNSNQSSIWGDNPIGGGIGVYGTCSGGTGVVAEGGNKGVFATCSSGNAVEGQTTSGYGVYGFAATGGVGGYFGSVSGYSLQAAGKVLIEETNDTALTVSQSSSAHLAAEFTNTSANKTLLVAGTSYSAYSGAGKGKIYAVDGFTPFTGSHNAVFRKGKTLEVGDIVVDSRVVYKQDISNTLCEVERSSRINQKASIGVFVSLENFNDDLVVPDEIRYNLKPFYNLISINSLGEGQINVCGRNGNIEIGDLITTSDLDGKGMKQSDDIIRNYSVAKARESVTFDFSDQVKQIACIYLAG